MAQPRVIVIHYLYLANRNPVFVSTDILQVIERLDDDLKVADSIQLCATIFL